MVSLKKSPGPLPAAPPGVDQGYHQPRPVTDEPGKTLVYIQKKRKAE